MVLLKSLGLEVVGLWFDGYGIRTRPAIVIWPSAVSK